MIELINKLSADFQTYPTITEWEKKNQPDENLIYKNGLSVQAKQGLAIINLVNFVMPESKVASTHSSKSVGLPVQMFKIFHYENGGAFVFVRDNFYDIKMSVVSEFPISLDYNFVHRLMSQEEYDIEKNKCIGYSGDRMTEAEKLDDNWIKGWSGCSILRKDNKIWKAQSVSSCYCEGIEKLDLPLEVFKAYEDGKTMFTLSIGTWTKVSYIMDQIYYSVQHGAYEKLNKQREQTE